MMLCYCADCVTALPEASQKTSVTKHISLSCLFMQDQLLLRYVLKQHMHSTKQ